MAEVKFIEEASKLGIDITATEGEIITSELGLMTKSMAATKQVFQLKITNLITQLETRGLSDQQVINVLLDDLNNDGQIFGGLKRQLIGDSQEFIEVAGSRLTAEEFQIQSGEESGTWVAILVNTCEDCLPRHGQTKTYNEWEELGMPRSGFSVCKSKCQCDVFPASVTESKEELRLPLKRAKGKLTSIARDKKKAGEIKSIKKYVNRNLGTINDTKSPLRPQIRKVLPGFKR
jgi:hypothetical protein